MSDIFLGKREIWGQEAPVFLSAYDRLHHLYAVGKSGTGKSTLLRNLILQDIEAGRGVALIDPHGDLSSELLDFIPRHRIEDLVYFDPADLDYPIGFNLLSHTNPNERHLIASGVVSVFKNIWPDFWGPRLEYILYAAIAALLECENVSLLAVQRMLSDKRYRAWVVRQVKDPMVRQFWLSEFENFDKRFVSEITAPVQNKTAQFLMSPHVRNILGQVKSKIDARFMMDNERVFIANLSKGKLGADKTSLIGALLVTQFQVAAMSRADIPEENRKPYFLYVDEFQAVSSDSFISILSEARKFALSLTLSHQYLDQVRPEILNSVLGNVGSMVSFRVGHKDATLLKNAFGDGFNAEHFIGLSNGEIVAKLLSNGSDSAPFCGKTLPPQGTYYGRRETIIKRSREKYATRRNVIERKIKKWLRGY